MRRTHARPGRGRQPALEPLEGRKLLSATARGSGLMASALAAEATSIPASDRQFAYTTPQGTHVLIKVYGVGSLAGTSVDPDGALNLVFGETNEQTGIVARVSGGTRQAPLRSVHTAKVAIGDLSGIGGTVLNVLNLKDFNLVSGGRINLTSGVHNLILNSVGQDTQVNVRELSEQFTASTSSNTSGTTGGSANSGTTNGITQTFSTDSLGARTLTSVSGTFVAPTSLPDTKVTSTTTGTNPGPAPAPPGVLLSIKHIQGPARDASSLGDPQVFGYDPTANALIRFDAITGNPTLTIPLAGAGTPSSGAALGRDNGRLVALIGMGSTIRAFDAVTGAPVGQFSTANLDSAGLKSVDGLGSTDTETVLSDSTDGLLQAINVTASLASGQAVAIGNPLSPQRELELGGGLTGVAASRTIYGIVAAHFDAAQPDLTQAGIVAVDTSGGQLREVSRTALKGSNGSFLNAGAPGTTQASPFQALGSIDQNLALVTSVTNGVNVVTLFAPQTLATTGTLKLNDPNHLSGLSESFRPDIQGSALIDVQGNVQSLRADDAKGMVLNVAGYLNLAKISTTTDTTIVAMPFGHAQMPHRSDVKIFSSSRPVDNRNGVTVVSSVQQVGPLSFPD